MRRHLGLLTVAAVCAATAYCGGTSITIEGNGNTSDGGSRDNDRVDAEDVLVGCPGAPAK